MRIHDDFNKRVHVVSHKMDWVPSPLKGVDRRMLDRIGEEVARATTIVRYAPGSTFSPHKHSGGEEFIVLDGVFSDEHGDYGPGYYVRNPRGSSHKPFSKNGCTIFVKLWQMVEADQKFVRTDTENAAFSESTAAGIKILDLHHYEGENVRIEKWEAGSTDHRAYEDGAEYLVLQGQLEDEDGQYGTGDWLRLPPGYSHQLKALKDTRLYLKTGHLTKPLDLPA